MKKASRIFLFVFGLLGFDIRKFLQFWMGIPFFARDYWNIKKSLKGNSDFRLGKFHPILNERNSQSGTMTGHYFHQDLFVAQKIFLSKPTRHVDIGSRVDGFVAHVASFRAVEVLDIRPLTSKVRNIKFTQADLMQLPSGMISSCESVSALHVIEHFGLGRYGDPIDINGHLKALSNIHAMLKPKGKFYFSVPIGKQRIEFNAHRVFSLIYLKGILERSFTIESFSYVDDNGHLVEDVSFEDDKIVFDYGCNYGCGIFDLTKKEL